MYFLNEKSPVKMASLLFFPLTIFIFYPFISYSYEEIPDKEDKVFELMLAGGGLKTCSSMANNNCTKKSFSDDDKHQTLYQVSAQSIERFVQTQAFLQLSSPGRLNIHSLLTNINIDKALTLSELRGVFDDAEQLDLYRALPDNAYYALLDSLELTQVDKNGNRKRERVSLAQNKNLASVEIYEAFVRQARLRLKDHEATPRIAIVTASSRDPFEVADFYLSAFKAAGAEVIWLPLDQTYQKARALHSGGLAGCARLAAIRASHNSFYRERIYPERTQMQYQYCLEPKRMLDDLSSVQGVFFNGGDQSLTLKALKHPDGSDTDELRVIRERMNSGDLIVGGTSAGTAVQGGGIHRGRPLVMLTNGHSGNALSRGPFANAPPSQRCQQDATCGQGLESDDLTYNPQGGSGLFSLGLLDTHFSERDRETRLATFVSQTRQDFGFGVDETTALLVGKSSNGASVHFEVIGQNGVFIADQRIGHFKVSKGLSDNIDGQVELSGVSHFLNTGSRATYHFNQDKWVFSLAGALLETRVKLKPLDKGLWRDQTRQACGSNRGITWQQFDNLYQLKASNDTEFRYDKTNKLCSYHSLPFLIVHRIKDVHPLFNK